MPAEKYIDCELQLSNYDQAELRFEDYQFDGKPVLDENLQQRLLEASLDATQYGTMLFSALLPPSDNLLSGYRKALMLAQREFKRLRFHMHIDANAPQKLHELNWELLYDPKERIALSCSPDTAFSRFTSVDRKPLSALNGTPKFLVVISSPVNQDEQGLAEIERSASIEASKKALNPLSDVIRYEILDGRATPGRINQRLQKGRFHVLHIQAHGQLHGAQGKPSIVLEKDSGEADYVDPDTFWAILEGNRDLRLVTLITCYGGATTRDNPYGGLGPMLARQGLPAVIAMRQSISVDSAALFSEHFYSNLAKTGQVDVAVNEARKQMYLAKPPPRGRAWGCPALFMRLADGKLWDDLHPRLAMPALGIGADISWQAILLRMSQDKIVPIIGPEVNRGLLLSRAKVSEYWAKEYNYPGDDVSDLPRVAKFVETMTGINFPHALLPEVLKNDLLEREKVQNREALKGLSLSGVIQRIAQSHFDRDADEPYRILAELPISTYITTNPDSFMQEALVYVKRKEHPQRKNCLWRTAIDDQKTKALDSPYARLQGTYEEPLVFHLYGFDENTSSLVLTEDDYLEFLRLVSQDPWRIPRKLKEKLTDAMLLFLGYDVRDLGFRVLFKGLLAQLKDDTLDRIAVLQIHRDGNYTEQQESIQTLKTFIQRDCDKSLRIQVCWTTVPEFLTELRDRYKAKL